MKKTKTCDHCGEDFRADLGIQSPHRGIWAELEFCSRKCLRDFFDGLRKAPSERHDRRAEVEAMGLAGG